MWISSKKSSRSSTQPVADSKRDSQAVGLLLNQVSDNLTDRSPDYLSVSCWTGSQLPELRALRILQSSGSLFRQHDVRVKIGLQGFAIFEQRMQVHLYLRRAQAR